MNKILIEKKAYKLLNDNAISDVPIPLEKIINKLGIKLGMAPSNQYSGILIRKKNGITLMGLNSNESYTRRRFTMGHELGHYFLHGSKNIFIDKRIMVEHRLSDKPETKDISEKIADVFSAALLMPAVFIKKDFYNIASKGYFLDEHIAFMSDKYQVSKEAMRYRLANLNLININI